MLLAIDAGNTNIVFALYEGDVRRAMWRCKTDSGRSSEEYLSFLLPLFDMADVDLVQVEDVIISSVVPDANFALEGFVRLCFGRRAIFIGRDVLDYGIDIRIDRPSELGADRIVNTVAVLQHYKPPAIVVDFGTATTIDVVDDNGAFAGGIIAPGANLSLAALHMAAAKLPKISIGKPVKVIATNTVDAMQSGVYWGYVGLVEGIITRMIHEMGYTPFVIATGGLAPLFKEAIPAIDVIDEELTLKGLLSIYLRLKSH
ncbi:MAG: type III pantothenate kinase [Pseudobdellovibrionaceae bacterium]